LPGGGGGRLPWSGGWRFSRRHERRPPVTLFAMHELSDLPAVLWRSEVHTMPSLRLFFGGVGANPGSGIQKCPNGLGYVFVYGADRGERHVHFDFMPSS